MISEDDGKWYIRRIWTVIGKLRLLPHFKMSVKAYKILLPKVLIHTVHTAQLFNLNGFKFLKM